MEASEAAVKPEIVFIIFMATWAVLGVSSFVFFYLGKNGRLKRILWLINVILVGILFVIFVYLIGFRSKPVLPVIPTTIFIMIANIATVRFCLSCGHMAMHQNPFKRLEQCPKCGAAFKQDNRSQSDDLSILQGDWDC